MEPTRRMFLPFGKTWWIIKASSLKFKHVNTDSHTHKSSSACYRYPPSDSPRSLPPRCVMSKFNCHLNSSWYISDKERERREKRKARKNERMKGNVRKIKIPSQLSDFMCSALIPWALFPYQTKDKNFAQCRTWKLFNYQFPLELSLSEVVEAKQAKD